ncbi:hypothetical protein PS3A_58250 [Pseudomonas sp. 3A(2025)]
MAGSDTATMVWSSALRKVAIIRANKILPIAGEGGLERVTAKPEGNGPDHGRAVMPVSLVR